MLWLLSYFGQRRFGQLVLMSKSQIACLILARAIHAAGKCGAVGSWQAEFLPSDFEL
jgi:hypothetical protein